MIDAAHALERSSDRFVETSLGVLRAIFGEAYARWFSIVCWDGTRVEAAESPRFVLRLQVPYALRAAFLPPLDLNPGRAFVNGWYALEGDIEAAIDTFSRAVNALPKSAFPLLVARLLRLPKPPRALDEGAHLRGRIHSRRRDADAIGFHYDQPLAFYEAFLDPALVYSCAYFEDGITSLEAAQQAKIDYILRKVRLRPGQRLLDIGCGWGALVMRAAERFGAKTLGITLSRAQYGEARRRVEARGLGDRVRIERRDYRDLRGEEFDAIVSVGMVEHVGRAHLAGYFEAALAVLRPGGLFLNHGIAEESPGRTGGRATGFIERYVFPDGELVAIGDVLAIAERAGFEVRDVENLREHYARTLRDWISSLERNEAAVIAATDERTFRIWRLYMGGSAQGFASGRMGLFQSLLAKADPQGYVAIPATRRDLYPMSGTRPEGSEDARGEPDPARGRVAQGESATLTL